MNLEIFTDKVTELQAHLEAMPQINLQTTHALINGLYARTIFIPAGAALVGCEHKTDHLNICSGDISVTTDAGTKRLTGFHVLETKAGHKRAGYAHADTWWSTVCKSPIDDIKRLDEIEDALVVGAAALQTRHILKTDKKESIE